MLDSAIQKDINFISRSFDSLGAPCQSCQNSLKWPFLKITKKNNFMQIGCNLGVLEQKFPKCHFDRFSTPCD